MSSLSNIEEHLEEQTMKKQGVDNSEEKAENAKQNDANLPKTMEAGENKELETSITMADLPPSAGHRKLPPELNCQIYYCLNVPTRRKFICGLGWDFYAMFRQQLLIKYKRLCNPEGIVWSRSNRNFTISEDGLIVTNTKVWHEIYAEKGFPISVADCRMDDFPGTICYYFEVKTLSRRCVVGLSISRGGVNFGTSCPTNEHLGEFQRSEFRVGARPETPNVVYGSGILIDPDNTVTIFFTLNGILLGKQIPISPYVDTDRLFPAVSIWENLLTYEANFGNDPANGQTIPI